jgi:hypothetical protein
MRKFCIEVFLSTAGDFQENIDNLHPMQRPPACCAPSVRYDGVDQEL